MPPFLTLFLLLRPGRWWEGVHGEADRGQGQGPAWLRLQRLVVQVILPRSEDGRGHEIGLSEARADREEELWADHNPGTRKSYTLLVYWAS